MRRRHAAGPGGAALLAVDTRAGHVFVPGAMGLSMLDARTGRLLHTTALTTATGALVLTVDEADGRLFVSDDVRFEPSTAYLLSKVG